MAASYQYPDKDMQINKQIGLRSISFCNFPIVQFYNLHCIIINSGLLVQKSDQHRMSQQVEGQVALEVAPQKTPQQLLQQQRQRQEEEKAKQEERKKLQEQAKIKTEEDKKKLDQALKGALSGLSKTNDNKIISYVKLTLAEKQLERVFPSILRYHQIKYLDISTNTITDPSILTQFKHLVSLNLSKNQISSLQAFKTDKLQELQFLNISTNKIKILSQINLPSLRRLNLTENQISAIDWKGHSTIQILQLRKNKFRKLKGIANLKCLVQLYVCENQVTDIRGLENVPNLEKLYLRNNKIKTIMSPFPHLPSLKHINFRQNQIASTNQLKKLPINLRSINILANPLTEQLGQNLKRDIIFVLPHYVRINKSDVTTEERLQFEKQLQEKLAQRQRQRLEKQAQQAQARKAQEQARQAQQQAKKAAEQNKQ